MSEIIQVQNNGLQLPSTIRDTLMGQRTDPFYVKSKQGFLYVVSSYIDDVFKKHYPFHQIHLVGNPEIISNYWIRAEVEVRAYLDKDMFISNVGSGGSRLQISKEWNDSSKRLKEEAFDSRFKLTPDERMKKLELRKQLLSNLTPMDWIDVSHSSKSAITMAIANAQVRFGCCADIYNKGIIPSEKRAEIIEAIEQICSKIQNPIEKMNIKNELALINEKNGNIVLFFNRIVEKYEIEIPENL